MCGRLSIGNSKDEVYYIGYRLKVTPCEYKLLAALAKRERCSSEELAREIGFDAKRRGNVAVHICAINRKAEIIGGRRLVLSDGSIYYFNERM